MNSLLIEEPPLQVLPSLACKVGLNEAIVLQQFHYWLQRSNNVQDGYKWIYNSYSEWHKQFPFWKSRNTLITTIKHLEKQGLLVSGNYNKAKFDNTKWYRIDYEKLASLENSSPLTKNWYTSNQDLVSPPTKNEQTYTKRLPENNKQEINSNNVERQTAPSGKPEQTAEIIGYLNKRVGTHYRATTRKTQALIKARLNEGFTVDDFKKVIDNKAEAWLGDQKMEKYLRPETLFGTKFEGYLNERSAPRVGGDGIVVGTDYAKLAKEQDEAYQKSLENMGEVHDKELPW